MLKSYRVTTLCGSTRFKDEFYRVAKELTLEGWICLYPSVFSHNDNDPLDEDTIRMLANMHDLKIEMSDSIHVINKDGYIGKSTEREIIKALCENREVYFMEFASYELKKSLADKAIATGKYYIPAQKLAQAKTLGSNIDASATCIFNLMHSSF